MSKLPHLILPVIALVVAGCASESSTSDQKTGGLAISTRFWSPKGTVAETLAADRSRRAFDGAAKAAGLYRTLSGPGPVTVFAPDDQAFAATSVEASHVAACHVIPADLTPKVLSGMIKQNGGSYPVITTGGCVLTATQVRNVVTLTDQNGNAATLKAGPQRRGNGMVYKIDKVFSPAGSSLAAK
jgi:uncharacterized surface protein with fasciclin (FAS1) repeats